MPKRIDYALIFSDIHSGGKLGLCNPNATTIETTEKVQGGEIYTESWEEPVQLNGFQEYLWESLTKEWLPAVKKIVGKNKITLISGGDLTQGNRWKTHLMTNTMENQYRLAVFSVLPFLQLMNVHQFFLVTGTEVHIGEEGIAPHQVKMLLRLPEFREQYKNDIDMHVAHHLMLDVNGFVMDVAHHGSGTGSRTWLKGNMIRYEMKSNILAEKLAGNMPPDLYVRGHFHSPIEEDHTQFISDQPMRTKSIVVPSLAGMNMHARKVTRSAPSVTNGIALAEIIDGKTSKIHWFMKTLDLRTKKKVYKA